MTEGDLEGLIRLTAEGHSEAAEELARRVEGPVRAAVRPRLGPELRMRVETEDILQSTIVASLRDLSGFEYRGEQAFLAWLARVAEHRIRYAARFHRAAKRDLRRDRPLAAAARVAEQGTSPSQAASRTEVTVGLHRAVERLPEPDRSVVRLHSFDGLAFHDVAERLGLKDKNQARWIFQRALMKVGDLLSGEKD